MSNYLSTPLMIDTWTQGLSHFAIFPFYILIRENANVMVMNLILGTLMTL